MEVFLRFLVFFWVFLDMMEREEEKEEAERKSPSLLAFPFFTSAREREVERRESKGRERKRDG